MHEFVAICHVIVQAFVSVSFKNYFVVMKVLVKVGFLVVIDMVFNASFCDDFCFVFQSCLIAFNLGVASICLGLIHPLISDKDLHLL